MYKISKSFQFSAAHHLEGLPADHPCSRHHGHNYEVIVELKSEFLNEIGFVRDYNDLKPVKEYIDNTLDHRDLNDILPMNPTAEHIGQYLFHVIKYDLGIIECSAVTVKETPKTEARYEPS